MTTIYHYYNNNNLFKAGFLIGAGLAFMISGTMFSVLGSYHMIKYGFE
jgi:hypothetical protein